MKRLALCLLALTASVCAQVTFELSGPTCVALPFPCGAPGDFENLSGNGAIFGTALATVDVANAAGFPTQGLQYGRVRADGAGAALATHLYIPVPLGATSVSFNWDFYSAEGTSATFNDAMSIDVIGACGGASLATLAYADSATFVGGGFFDTGTACSSGAEDLAPGGPQTVTNAVLPAGALYIQVACWNGADNIGDSAAVIDCVNFNAGPCLPPPPPCVLFFSSPFGPGSLQIDNTQCAASANLDYQIGVTLAPGVFPTGWFFGLDITLTELINQHGATFQNILWGTLDGTGASTFGPVGGLPSGLQIWAVTSEWTTGFGTAAGARAPVTYTIP